MQIVWLIHEDQPIPRLACEKGIQLLAEELKIEIPADAIVLMRDHDEQGAYPVSQAIGSDGTVWNVDYSAVQIAIVKASDAELRSVGLDPDRQGFVFQALRLVRRELLHWPIEQIRELTKVLPDLQQLAIDYEFEAE